jgi:hypothetical protein
MADNSHQLVGHFGGDKLNCVDLLVKDQEIKELNEDALVKQVIIEKDDSYRSAIFETLVCVRTPTLNRRYLLLGYRSGRLQIRLQQQWEEKLLDF